MVSAPSPDFGKRRYTSVREFLDDLAFVMRSRGAIREDRRTGRVSPAFKERLMLCVTHVNECRYCSFVHTREALRHGVGPEEVEALFGGCVEGCPEEEVLALLYAQHWAETDGRPEPAARERLVERYGPERADTIDRVLRMIRAGNLMGNTFDYLLYRLTWGRLGMDTGALWRQVVMRTGYGERS